MSTASLPPPRVVPRTVDGFETVPMRVRGEQAERLVFGEQRLRYYQSYFDDYLRGLLPHDLVVIGAYSGVGKTQIALDIAASNARAMKRVHYFALEAEPRELERRIKYAKLKDALYRDRHPRRFEVNYASWYIGEVEDICGPYNAPVELEMLDELCSLSTYYKHAHFDLHALAKSIAQVHEHSDLIVVDHLHYVDSDDPNKSDNRALSDIVKTMRDISLRIGKPIVVVAHLRKPDTKSTAVMPSLFDFHGSSDLTKIATQVVVLERAHDVAPAKWFYAPTYMAILKDRRCGAPPYVALTTFDTLVAKYRPEYTLGKIVKGKFDETPIADVPTWAKWHRPIEKGEASTQAPIAGQEQR